MRVHEVLDIAGDIEKSEVDIEGFFVMRNGVGYFSESFDEIDRKDRAIFVASPKLEEVLLSCVPAYGGGKYSYCDRASISGCLTREVESEFPYSIKNISDFIIFKYGEAINVDLDPWKGLCRSGRNSARGPSSTSGSDVD